ncbi:hypothetical protein [Pelomonas sp. SE-A7]|uniref:hypothetical protein n=1 Tax=Pelomonas sp. SE-A7 TaxID=3054953 RepID=UPI00259CC142|nr:hypothetical protein [Pelomonas sp. SE-A7]MDM4768536.1 hypothetical protein [Pelomonas sp. SE-A7]
MQYATHHQPSAATLQHCAREAMQGRCGWFDSSFELNHGLEISEVDSQLDFDLWIVAFDVAQALKH